MLNNSQKKNSQLEQKTDPFWDTVDYEPVTAQPMNNPSEQKTDPFWDTIDYDPVDEPAAQNQPQDSQGLLESAYKAFSRLTPELRDTFNRTIKAPLAGSAGGLIDSFATPVNASIGIHNAALEQNSELDPATYASLYSGGDVYAPWVPKGQAQAAQLPGIPSAAGGVENLIDTATGGFSKDDNPGVVYEGIKAGASVLAPGAIGNLLGKGANAVGQFGSRLLNSVGSTNKAVVAGAAAGGAAQEYAREQGAGFGGQLGAGFGANILTQALNPKNLLKGTASAVGLGKNKFKLDDYDAGQRIGVDIPADALSESRFLGGAKKQTSKLFLANEHFREQNKKAGEQFQAAFEKVADTVGPKFTDEVEAAQKALYEKANRFLPDSAENIFTFPSNTSKTIKKVSIATDSLLGDKGKDGKVIEILREMNKSLPGDGKLPLPLQNLINSKRKLSPFIPWDAEKSNPLALVYSALNEDIAAYGKKNPEWYKAFKTADENFAQNAKRKTLDKLVEGKIEDPLKKEVEYLPFAKQLEDPKHRKRIQNILGESNVHKLDDFITSAKRLAQSEKNTTTFSGSELEVGAKKLANTAVAIATGALSTVGAIAEIGGVGIMTYLLSSKKFLNKAAEFARKPSEPLAKQLENIVKENTGYTIQALNKIYREKD